METASGRLQFVQETTGGTILKIVSIAVLPVETVHHVAVTKTGSTVRLYGRFAERDQDARGIDRHARTSAPIGMRDGSKPFGGTIDEVAIYDRALSSTRIQAHAAAA